MRTLPYIAIIALSVGCTGSSTAPSSVPTVERQQATTKSAEASGLAHAAQPPLSDRGQQPVPLQKLPQTQNALVLRTDFSDNSAWDSICAAIQQPSEMGFRAYVDCISDPAFEGLTVEQLIKLAPKGSGRSFVFIVDHMTLTHKANPVLVVDLFTEPGRTFRVIPSEMWSVENNLSLANMDFHSFADKVDAEGIHRGF